MVLYKKMRLTKGLLEIYQGFTLEFLEWDKMKG